MKTLLHLLLFITTVTSVEQNKDSNSETSHQSHSHSFPAHGSHHESHGYKPRILVKKIHVPVAIEKKIPYPVEKCVPTPVKVLVPFSYPVQKLVPEPYKIYIKVPTPILQKFPVEKIVPVPVRVPYTQPIPVKVFVPYPIPIEKSVPVILRIPVSYPIPIEKPIPIKLEHPDFRQLFPKQEELFDQDKNGLNPSLEENYVGKINQPGPENEAYSQVDNYDKGHVYQMIVNQLPNNLEENSEVPVKQKLIISNQSFDTKPFYPRYVMHLENENQSPKNTKIADAEHVKLADENDHYEGYDPGTVYEKKNNDYHQHLTESFDSTKLFDQSKQ